MFKKKKKTLNVSVPFTAISPPLIFLLYPARKLMQQAFNKHLWKRKGRKKKKRKKNKALG